MTKTFHQIYFKHDIINDSFLTFNFSNCQLVNIHLFYFIGQNHVKSHVICNISRSINMFEISFSEKKNLKTIDFSIMTLSLIDS